MSFDLNRQTITVVSTANARYFPGVLVTFYSLLTNLAPGWCVDFKLLTDELDERQRVVLRQTIECTGKNATLEIIQVDFAEYEQNPADYGGGKMAYARLLMPRLIAADRALYVDSDIVVARDVSSLTTLPWPADCLMYAVNDPKIPTFADEEMPYERLGISASTPYFNSGFLWVNLAAWKRCGVGAACLQYMRQNPDGLRWWDQSILNAVLWKNWRPLAREWNLPPERIMGRFGLYPFATERGINVHYLGPEKPWLQMHPYQHFYRACATKLARLIPDGFVLRRDTGSEVLQRWRYFLNRAYWNYGSFCKQGLLKLLR